MSRSLKQFSVLYYGLMAIFLVAVLADLVYLHYAVKPLFMIVLMVMHFQSTSDHTDSFFRAIQFGLFFSWIGDIMLMLPDQNGTMFIFGLLAFLIAHLGYSFGFYSNIKNSEVEFNVRTAVLMAVPFLLFTGLFYFYIKDGLGDLLLPVLAYTVVISTMGVFSALQRGHVAQSRFKWILLGAILFILSDCVIAINKFKVDFEYDKILNMVLYLTGQFLITIGAIDRSRSINSVQ